MEENQVAAPVAAPVASQVGVKELKELLQGIGAFGAVMAEVLKDGAQVSDVAVVVGKLIADPVLMDKIKAAVNGASLVGTEAKDLNFAEGVELAQCLYEQVVLILNAAKKQA